MCTVQRSNKIIPFLFVFKAELLATCRTNVQCLQAILSHFKMSENDLDARLPPHHELKPVAGNMSHIHILFTIDL